MQVLWRGVDLPVPTRIWRAVGYSYNTFAVESFIDELASSAGRDPVEFRHSHIRDTHPRLAHCLSRVADASGWPGPGPAGGTLGVAILSALGSYLALVAEVTLNSDDTPRVNNVWCIVDCGIAVNPDTVVAQIEGGILYGLDAAMYGKVSLVDGAIVKRNFDTYRVMRINEAPRIHVTLVPSIEAPGGVGELGVPAIAPAVANALVASGWQRTRQLPFVS